MLREALHKLLHKLLQTFHIAWGLLHEALELFLIELEGIREYLFRSSFFFRSTSRSMSSSRAGSGTHLPT